MTNRVPLSGYRKLSRFQAVLLAEYARSKKKIQLPSGWLAFYRLTPDEIVKKFPSLTVEEIAREARMEKSPKDKQEEAA